MIIAALKALKNNRPKIQPDLKAYPLTDFSDFIIFPRLYYPDSDRYSGFPKLSDFTNFRTILIFGLY